MINFYKLVDLYELWVKENFNPEFDIECEGHDKEKITRFLNEGFAFVRSVYRNDNNGKCSYSCECLENYSNEDDTINIIAYTFYYTYLQMLGTLSFYNSDPDSTPQESHPVYTRIVSDGFGNF